MADPSQGGNQEAAAQEFPFEPRHNVTVILDPTLAEAQDYWDIILFLRRSRIFYAISTETTIYWNVIQEFLENAEYFSADFIRSSISGTEILVSQP